MSRIGTILLALLAVAAIIFLAIYEPLTRSAREQSADARSGRVLSFDPAGVREIRLSSPTGELEIKRRGNGWQLGPKPKDRADSALIDKLLRTAADLEFFDNIPGSEFKDDGDWGDYGLRNPKRKIELRGEKDITLYIGKDGANEERLYVRRSGLRDVFLISDDILEAAFPEASRFRDRRLTDLDPGRVDRFIIRRAGGEMEFVHDARGWRMVRPLNAPADEKVVADVLGRLLDLRIQDFVADDSSDLSTYGITEGAREFSFFADGRERAQTLRLGAEVGEGMYAQFTARDTIYRLPREATGFLDLTPESFRDHRLLPLNLDMVDMVRFQTPGGGFVLRRNDDGWEVRAGDSARPASAAAVDALAETLSSTRVLAYIPAVGDKLAASGLLPPRASIEFVSVLSENTPEMKAGERVLASVFIGKSENGQLAVRLGDAPEFVSVPESLLHAIPLEAAAWVSPK